MTPIPKNYFEICFSSKISIWVPEWIILTSWEPFLILKIHQNSFCTRIRNIIYKLIIRLPPDFSVSSVICPRTLICLPFMYHPSQKFDLPLSHLPPQKFDLSLSSLGANEWPLFKNRIYNYLMCLIRVQNELWWIFNIKSARSLSRRFV